MFSVSEIEELKNYFQSIPESGSSLPNPREVPDWTVYFLLVDGVYIEHLMFKNNWYKKVVDSDSQIILEKV